MHAQTCALSPMIKTFIVCMHYVICNDALCHVLMYSYKLGITGSHKT